MLPEIIGGIGSAIAGLFGGKDHSAEDALKAIQDLYARTQTPNFDYSSLTPAEKAVVDRLTPETMQAIELAAPKVAQDSGQGRQAVVKALQKMQNISNQGGLTLEDKAALRATENEVNRMNRGNMDAITANMNARGAGGSGQELAAKMIAAQNATNAASDAGMRTAADARARALSAIMQSGQLGAQLREADLNASQRAADTINQFNVANWRNMQDIANQNVANRNSAQGFNINNAQNVANSNVDTRNQYQMYNQQNQNALKQQNFNNEMAKNAGQASMAQGIAKLKSGDAATANNNLTGIGGAIGTVAGKLLTPTTPAPTTTPQSSTPTLDDYWDTNPYAKK